MFVESSLLFVILMIYISYRNSRIDSIPITEDVIKKFMVRGLVDIVTLNIFKDFTILT